MHSMTYTIKASTFPMAPDTDKARNPMPICSKGNAMSVVNVFDKVN